MKINLAVCAALVAATSAVAPASATIITFENASTSASGTAVANGYAGLNWSNFYATNGTGYDARAGYTTGRVSGVATAFNGFADAATISSATAFTLNSGYFTGAWNNGLTITAVGFVNGIQAYMTNFVVNTTGPVLQTFGWSNLSSVRFSSQGGTAANNGGLGTHFAVDNLAVNELGAVPEPATWALMILGMGAVGFAMRRSRKAKVATTVRFA